MEEIIKAYTATNNLSFLIGSIIYQQKMLPDAKVNISLKSLNRHGLIAGATGSGKTKTIQVIAEQLSANGVPSFVMDIKGDLSGLALSASDDGKLKTRADAMGITYNPHGVPVNFMTLGGVEPIIPMRATVQSFGALLFARLLDLNDAQTGVLTILMQYADNNNLNLIDLEDIKTLLQYAQSDSGQAAISKQYGVLATTTLGIILRRIIELEAQGGAVIFGEPAFNINDLISCDLRGLGIVSVLRLFDMQEKPKVFSSFMLKLLSDVFRQLPEIGDAPKPKLVIFIDEAHLLFSNASKALLALLETTIKLIRSKGVGIIFCTQTPDDIPEEILSQLGLKIQHSLRAFTAKDRKAIKLVAQNFPPSEYYHTENLLTSLGIGEALLTALDDKGQPTPLIHCQIRPPESRMGVLTNLELQNIMANNSLYAKYKIKTSTTGAKESLANLSLPNNINNTKNQPNTVESTTKDEPNLLNTLSKNTLFRQLVRQFFRQVTAILLALFKSSNKRK